MFSDVVLGVSFPGLCLRFVGLKFRFRHPGCSVHDLGFRCGSSSSRMPWQGWPVFAPACYQFCACKHAGAGGPGHETQGLSACVRFLQEPASANFPPLPSFTPLFPPSQRWMEMPWGWERLPSLRSQWRAPATRCRRFWHTCRATCRRRHNHPQARTCLMQPAGTAVGRAETPWEGRDSCSPS